MKVKYSIQNQTLQCSNNDFSMILSVRVCDQESGQPLILFDPRDLYNFVELEFMKSKRNVDQDPNRCQELIDRFLYQGCSVDLENFVHINATGLKHLFSSLVSHCVFENSCTRIDWKRSKYLNWFLNFDFNSTILRALNLLNTDNQCKFCKKAGFHLKDSEPFCVDNSESISEWIRKIELKKDKDKYNDENFIAYLVCLFKRAAIEIKAIFAIDQKYDQVRSLDSPLTNYDPSADWTSSCPMIKFFIDEIMPEARSDLCKIIFKNLISIGSQKKNYPFKPKSAYFISCVLKYLQDKKKILDFLSSIGIAVGDDAVNRLEKRQINEFNSIFWDLSKSSTVSAVMDNNQADFSSKNYNPLHDEHHVDCLNVLQVIKPGGNPCLSKTLKDI